MKKLVFAFLMASACIGLVSAPKLRAQDSITIKDPAEFNAYQIATSQTDPKTKASQLEGFLTSYPQSVVKNAVLDMLLDALISITIQEAFSSPMYEKVRSCSNHSFSANAPHNRLAMERSGIASPSLCGC